MSVNCTGRLDPECDPKSNKYEPRVTYLKNENVSMNANFSFSGWPLSEWLLIQGWFKTRYGPAALPSDVQKVHDSWPGPWPGIDKEKE